MFHVWGSIMDEETIMYDQIGENEIDKQGYSDEEQLENFLKTTWKMNLM